MPRKKKDYRKVPSKHSAQVIASKARAVDLAAALRAQGDTLAAGLEKELGGFLRDGETMPDFRLMVELLERRVQHEHDRLDLADEKRFMEEMRLSVARWEAEEAHGRLHDETVKVRKSLVECFGAKRSRKQFSLSERTPRGMTDLAFEARTIVNRLDRPGLKLPDPDLAGLTADPASWADGLRAPVVRLEGLLREIAERQVKVVDGIAGCRRALSSFQSGYLHVARTAEALLVLGGNAELARRLRPKQKRERSAASGSRVALLVRVTRAGLAAVARAAARFWQWLREMVGRSASRARSGPALTREDARSRDLPVAEGLRPAGIG